MSTVEPDKRWWKSITNPDEYVKCETCQQRNAIGVASVPGVPYSAAYCEPCIKANAHPYWIVVANTADVGGYDSSAEWWKYVVRGTLSQLGKTREQFDADVVKHIEAEAEFWAKLGEQESSGEPPRAEDHQ